MVSFTEGVDAATSVIMHVAASLSESRPFCKDDSLCTRMLSRMTLSRLPGLRNHTILWWGLTRGTHKPSRTAAVGIVSIAVYGLLPVSGVISVGPGPGLRKLCERIRCAGSVSGWVSTSGYATRCSGPRHRLHTMACMPAATKHVLPNPQHTVIEINVIL